MNQNGLNQTSDPRIHSTLPVINKLYEKSPGKDRRICFFEVVFQLRRKKCSKSVKNPHLLLKNTFFPGVPQGALCCFSKFAPPGPPVKRAKNLSYSAANLYGEYQGKKQRFSSLIAPQKLKILDSNLPGVPQGALFGQKTPKNVHFRIQWVRF